MCAAVAATRCQHLWRAHQVNTLPGPCTEGGWGPVQTEGRRLGPVQGGGCLVKSNTSWVMVTWDPPGVSGNELIVIVISYCSHCSQNIWQLVSSFKCYLWVGSENSAVSCLHTQNFFVNYWNVACWNCVTIHTRTFSDSPYSFAREYIIILDDVIAQILLTLYSDIFEMLLFTSRIKEVECLIGKIQ